MFQMLFLTKVPTHEKKRSTSNCFHAETRWDQFFCFTQRVHRRTNIWDDSGRHTDFLECFGHGITDDQSMCLVDKFWETNSDRHVLLLSEREQPTIRRGLHSNRGDMEPRIGVSRSAVGSEEGSLPHRSGSRRRVHSCPLGRRLREQREEGESAGTLISGCWSPERQNLTQAHPAGRRGLPEGVCQFGQRPDHAEKRSRHATARRQASTRSGSAGCVT